MNTEKVNSLNDLIEGVELNKQPNDLASNHLDVNHKTNHISERTPIPVIMKPVELPNGEMQYNVFIDKLNSEKIKEKDANEKDVQYYSKNDDEYSKYESFTAYNEDDENTKNYSTFKKTEMDFVTRFYIGSVTVIGLYVFYKLIHRSR